MWRGQVTQGRSKKSDVVIWHGAWVGSSSLDIPPNSGFDLVFWQNEMKFLKCFQWAEFESSKTTFEAEGPSVDTDKQVDGQSLAGRWTSTYKLDNSGNGALKTFKDPAYQLSVVSVSVPEDSEVTRKDHTVLVGKGRNRFGDFVIAGTFDSPTKIMVLR